jgi:hypothetical protein
MGSRQDDSAPARFSNACGTLYRAAHKNASSARGSAAAGDSTAATRTTSSILYRVTKETVRLRKDVAFRVGARLGKIKREELENASTAVGGNVLRFIRTFVQYIEEIRPD